MIYLLAAFYGVMVGNYTTSAYFRIPQGMPVNGLNNVLGKKPHCSVCKHELKFYEYLPVLSWIFARFSCNYCNTAINPMYFIIEVATTISSLIIVAFLGMAPSFAMGVLVASMIILNLALFISHKKFYPKAILGFVVVALSQILIQ
ncbi:MAG: prepilin peptidase [Rickettsiales bacterium]